MKSCEKCGRPIADTAAACPYCGYSQAAELPNALQPGWEIAGRYRIESVIGLGGFGITYCAYDQKLACTVALKEYFPSGVANRIPGSKEVILYAGKRTEEFRQGYTRFLNEARNMIQFQSVPNVVQVREYFEENGTAYIVMEYLRGHTLKTEIERAPLTWERAVTIGAVICGNDFVGGLVGCNDATAKITNTSTSLLTVSGEIVGGKAVGGIWTYDE